MATRGFVEVQRFRQPWLVALMVGVSAVTLAPLLVGVVLQLGLGVPFGDRPMSDGALVATTVFTALVVLAVDWLLLAARLVCEVDGTRARVQFFPFHRRGRDLELSKITDIASVRYRPIRDYGGWGLRRGRNGWAYNVSGDRGVRLTYASGETLLIGSERPDELAAALRERWNEARSFGAQWAS